MMTLLLLLQPVFIYSAMQTMFARRVLVNQIHVIPITLATFEINYVCIYYCYYQSHTTSSSNQIAKTKLVGRLETILFETNFTRLSHDIEAVALLPA